MRRLQSVRDKQKISDGANTIPVDERNAIGAGWIVLNPNVDDYVRYCMETNTVSIFTTENELLQRCIIGSGTLSKIKFPKTNNEKGSFVIFANTRSTTPIVIDVVCAFNEKNSLQKDNSWQERRESGKDYVFFEGIAEDGIINLFARSEKGASINIKALNEQLQAMLDLYIQGKLQIETEDTINITTDREFTVNLNSVEPTTQKELSATLKYVMGEGFTLIDQYGNKLTTTEAGVQIQVPHDKAITLQGDQNQVESALLGDSTVKSLQAICDALSKTLLVIETLAVNPSNGFVLPNVTTQMQNINRNLVKTSKTLEQLKSKNNKIS